MGDRIEEKLQQFTPLQLLTSTKNLAEEIGHGAYGDVYRGSLENGKVVAIKVLKSNLYSETLLQQFTAEVITLGKTHHKNVVELCGFCSKDNMKAIVYEYMENGSLNQLLSRNQSIEWETLCTIAKGTAKGLSYLHEDCEPGIIHYDVKPSNILLDSQFIPKVGDFGLAKLLPEGATHITESGFRGTYGYIAPEFTSPVPQITHKCDVFSYGMTLFDIISWNYFKEDRSWFPDLVWKKFKEGHQDEFMEQCGIQIKNRKHAKLMFFIALRCVQFLPADRPSMSDVVRLLDDGKELELPDNPRYEGRPREGKEEVKLPDKPKNASEMRDRIEELLQQFTPLQLLTSEMGDRIEEQLQRVLQQFTPLQLQTSIINLAEEIGDGAQGDVYRGSLENGKVVAIKVFKSNLNSETLLKQFSAEVITLGKTHHRNVVELCGFCSKGNMKAIVYEYMENGSLKQLLSRNQSIEWETLCTIAKGTAEGLSYLHEDCEPGIIHYDVKPSNILLDSQFIPKVGDFGLAKLLPRDATHITCQSGFRGTPGYIAPEFYTPFSPITHKCDVFSYGMTLFDIICWNYVKDKTSGFPGQVWNKFNEGNQEDFMEQCGIHMKNREQAKRMFFIALRCVQHLPADRPSMSHVVRLLEGKEELTLPNDPQYVPKRIICEENCLIIGAKELQIYKGDNPEHWRWTTDAHSRFPEVAQLVSLNLIEIRSKINDESLRHLLPDMTYVVFLVFKVAENAHGLDLKTKVRVSFTDGKKGATGTRSVYLDPSGQRRLRRQYPLHSLGQICRFCDRQFRKMSASISQSVCKSRFPCEREDGWMEIQMGKFNNGDEYSMLDVSLVINRNLEKFKSGLIVAGIELRPKFSAWRRARAKASLFTFFLLIIFFRFVSVFSFVRRYYKLCCLLVLLLVVHMNELALLV